MIRATYKMTDKNGWEVETCGRCGGSGQHSYNQIDGTTCFGCSGTGKRFTKRAVAARFFWRASMMKPAGEVVVGDYIKASAFQKWAKVVEIKVQEKMFGNPVGGETVWTAGLHFHVPANRTGLGASADSLVQTCKGDDELRARKVAALAYQDSLTKAGKVSAASSA